MAPFIRLSGLDFGGGVLTLRWVADLSIFGMDTTYLHSVNASLLPSKVRRNGLFWLPQERASKAKVFGHPIKERVTEGNE